MKTRVTLTIDPEVSHRAKRTARERGTSVSGLVEKLLAEVTGTARTATPASLPSFSARWAGKGKLANRDDVRYRRLAAKYLT